MKDAQYFNATAAHPVGNDIRGARNDQFASANDPSRAARRGMGPEAFDCLDY